MNFEIYDKINLKDIKRVANDVFNFNKINIIVYGKVAKKELHNIKQLVNKLIK